MSSTKSKKIRKAHESGYLSDDAKKIALIRIENKASKSKSKIKKRIKELSPKQLEQFKVRLNDF